MSKDQFQVYQKALIIATKNPPLDIAQGGFNFDGQSALSYRSPFQFYSNTAYRAIAGGFLYDQEVVGILTE